MQQHIHILGIGGMGMSGIARILSHKGYHVTGCDAQITEPIPDTTNDGITVTPHHSPTCVSDDIDIIVHSTAIDTEHNELRRARSAHIPIYTRSDILPYITDGMFVIAVSGTHGKTTTTALIGHILTHAGLDPTVVVGGYVADWKSNVRVGSSNILVIEADESDKSLLNIHPHIAVITSLDYDHTQTYESLHETARTFISFIHRMQPPRILFTCADDTNLSYMHGSLSDHATYGFDADASYQCHTYNAQSMTVSLHGTTLSCSHHLLGPHNVRNMLAAIAVADTYHISPTVIQSAIHSFSGIARRCEFQQYVHGVPCYDDYAHHPTEIYNMVYTLNEHQYKYPCVIFQPHRYSRFQSLWHDFVYSFTHLPNGHIIVIDIYAAGELPHPNVSSQTFAEHLRHACPHLTITYMPSPFLTQLHAYLDKHIAEHDICITLGAGDITRLHAIL